MFSALPFPLPLFSFSCLNFVISGVDKLVGRLSALASRSYTLYFQTSKVLNSVGEVESCTRELQHFLFRTAFQVSLFAPQVTKALTLVSFGG